MADKKISALTSATTPLAGTEVLPIVQGGSTVKVAVSDLTAGRAVGANGLTSTANIRTEYSAAGNVTTITNNTSSAAGATSQLYNVNDAARALRIQYSSSGGIGGSGLTNGVTTETAQIFTDGNYPIVLGTNVSAALILDTSQNAKIINNLVIGTAGKGIDFSAATHSAGMTSELLNDYEEGTWTPSDGSGAGLSLTVANATYTKIGRLVTANFAITYPATASATNARIDGLPFASSSVGFSQLMAVSFCQTGICKSGLVDTSATTFLLSDTAGNALTNAQMSTLILRGTVIYEV
jgi:hypothetical protein